MMNLILWMVFGIVTGLIANFVDPRPAQGGIVGSLFLGIVGALVGGFLASTFFGISISGFNLESFAVAVVGSLLVLYLARILRSIEDRDSR